MIYFDNAATTKCSSETLTLYNKYASECFFNPSSLYSKSVQVKAKINECRKDILHVLNGQINDKIIFTSSGTEGNVTSLLCSRKNPGSTVIFSQSEHSSTYNTSIELKERGFNVVYCPVDKHGVVDCVEFEKILNPNVSFVSIIHVNNETGGINNIEKLVKIAKKHSPELIFHSDGVQAVGKIRVDLRKLNVDLYSFSGHKIGAPKGVGGLFIKNGINLSPLVIGGGQEFGLRGATENVPGIVTLGDRVLNRTKNLTSNHNYVSSLFAELIVFFSQFESVEILSTSEGSPYILSIASSKIRGEVLQHMLESHDILIGTGSACNSSKRNKRIPLALKLDKNKSVGMIRLSFTEKNTFEEILIFQKVFKTLYNGFDF